MIRSAAQNVYVDAQKGDDANPGTATSPLRTVTKALATVTKDGASILLREAQVFSDISEGVSIAYSLTIQ